MPNEQHATSKPAKKFSLPPPPDASPKPYLKMQKQLALLTQKLPDCFTEFQVKSKPALTPTHDLLETYEESPMNSEVMLLPKIEKEGLQKEKKEAEEEKKKEAKEDEKQSKSFNVKEWVQEVKKRMEA